MSFKTRLRKLEIERCCNTKVFICIFQRIKQLFCVWCEFYLFRIGVSRQFPPHSFHACGAALYAESFGGVSRARSDVEVIDVLNVIGGHLHAETRERLAVCLMPEAGGGEQGAVKVEQVSFEAGDIHQYHISGASFLRYLRASTSAPFITMLSALLSPEEDSAVTVMSVLPALLPKMRRVSSSPSSRSPR